MKNKVYEQALVEFQRVFGSPQELAAGTGARFVSAAKGKATLYHEGVATGNGAELAFEIESLAKRMKDTPNGARQFIASLRTLTTRDVDVNAKFNWPRVGFSTLDHVAQVKNKLVSRLEKK